MDEKVSIILPTFGRSDRLPLAIESVINQTYHNWELIVVDDNDPSTVSRMKTEELMKSYSHIDNIYYLKHPYNKNGSAARNTGIDFASGEYITFLDDDDQYLPERISQCVKVLKDCPSNYGGVYTGCKFYHNGKFYRNCKTAQSGNFLVETLSTTFQSYSGSNLFFKASIVKELKGFDESFTRHQDYEFLVRFFYKYDIIGISKILLIKNENGSNIPNIEKFVKIKEQYLNKYSYILDNLSDTKKKEIFFSNFIGLAQMALESNKHDLYDAFIQKAYSIKKPSIILIIKLKLIKIIRFIKG